MPAHPILHVAVPAPLRHALQYLPPDGAAQADIRPGMRVIVPLGSRRLVGVITDITSTTNVDPARLRPVIALPDRVAVVTPDVLQLALWAAQYYHAMVGDAVLQALPTTLRSLKPPSRSTRIEWYPTLLAAGLGPDALRRAPRQADALRLLLTQGRLTADDWRSAGIDAATLRALRAKGLADTRERPEADSDPDAPPADQDQPPELNPFQAQALAQLEPRLDGFAAVLLEGVTGSGKTEVYLRFIERVLARGRQALVLVPEIGLTPQTARRFTRRFRSHVVVLHSGLGDRARLRAWQDCASGKARIVIGTRSALFSPLPELGAIIVDEEHDASFKQQEGMRYSARDLAVYRARLREVPVLLGSATPSPETLANCASGRFLHLTLPERAGNARPPRIGLMDIRGKTLSGGLSDAMLDRIRQTLDAGNQALVFLNRRGWAPVYSCGDCGWLASCPHCDARLTLHRERSLLWCHHCDFRTAIARHCPSCGSHNLLALGAGTERSEHTLQQHFPAYPIHRIDRGTMHARDAMQTVIDRIDTGQPCILVGTQMLAKGHHFPGVTLVAIVDLDGGLFSADFRAAERTGQLLIQVAGRAGRAERAGEVLVQTRHPDHPWLQRLVNGGYRAFIDPILAERATLGLPPHAHLAVLRTECKDAAMGQRALHGLKQKLRRVHPQVDLLGPIPAALPRRAGLHRLQLMLKHPHRSQLHAALDTLCHWLDARIPGIERWILDVDPSEGA